MIEHFSKWIELVVYQTSSVKVQLIHSWIVF
jgi:hypothetical protein